MRPEVETGLCCEERKARAARGDGRSRGGKGQRMRGGGRGRGLDGRPCAPCVGSRHVIRETARETARSGEESARSGPGTRSTGSRRQRPGAGERLARDRVAQRGHVEGGEGADVRPRGVRRDSRIWKGGESFGAGSSGVSASLNPQKRRWRPSLCRGLWRTLDIWAQRRRTPPHPQGLCDRGRREAPKVGRWNGLEPSRPATEVFVGAPGRSVRLRRQTPPSSLSRA